VHDAVGSNVKVASQPRDARREKASTPRPAHHQVPGRQEPKLPHWRPISEQPIHKVQRQARHDYGLEKRPPSSRNRWLGGGKRDAQYRKGESESYKKKWKT
jgi:hypothetical protein